MTPLTDAADQASVITPPPQAPTRNRKRSLAGVLADPRVRLGAGTAALLVTAMAVRRDRVGPCEAAAFRAVNGLPSPLYPPAWVIMQLGALGTAPAAAGAAWLAGDRELAGRLLAGGTSAWALSKVVKRLVRRPRPAGLLAGTRRRGREPAGLGYLSGHAGVAVALGAAAFPRLRPGGRALTLAAVPVVGLTRIYVGAHLPLDVAGGAALGFVVEAALTLARRTAAAPAVPTGPFGPHAAALRPLARRPMA
jgi:glycosyltransferase 2 family protein